MTDSQVKTVFWEAVELPGLSRREYLDQACADNPSLRERVEQLLAAHDDADTVLRGAAAWRPETVELSPGDRVGPYLLGEKLGEGGFGVVFAAEQYRPVRRRVALKVVKLGMDTEAVIARFEVERQALALMDHPGIATVFDAGSTDRGRPYFVMERVEGEPITSYCAARDLSLRARLELFRTVCLALHHAHQKGVIHRDIKPSNVLVAEVDGVPVPKLIDFGIAKATHTPLTQASLHTGEGRMLGTPAYMSPEHVDSAGAVDTRSDVYSLGALLYELLTGAPPFAGEARLLDLLERVRSEDPVSPSARQRSGHTTTGTIRLLPELDWITLRCLEKDPARRYASAIDLARDLTAFLENRPVEAAPPSRWYRVRKLARRNRVVTMAIATISAGALVGLVGLLWGLSEARESAEHARESAREAESSATAARLSADEARREHENVLRLSAFQDLQDLRTSAVDLWPATPDRIEEFRTWLAAADGLVRSVDEPSPAGGPSHRELLERLRARAVERPEDDGEWRFANETDRWWHAQIEKLITEIEEFADSSTGVIDGVSPAFGWGVRRRLAHAEAVAATTVSGPTAAEAWHEAMAAIADPEGPYGGLELTPQQGLLPIGPDPDSGLWEFVDLQFGTVPDRSESGRLEIEPETGVVFVLVPGGDFSMGAQADDPDAPGYDPDAYFDEKPVRRCRISALFVSKYELTQAQWTRVTGVNPSRYNDRTDLGGRQVRTDHPVEHVSWYESLAVVERHGLRLPTEAEWEYFARAGTSTPWYTGEDREALHGHVNIADAAARRGGAVWSAIKDWPEFDDGFVVHAPVGSFAANPFGLHEVQGNVWEWCQDGYFDRYRPGPVIDPLVPPESSRSRIVRGGGFALTAASTRCANRDPLPPESRTGSIGLRPVRSIR